MPVPDPHSRPLTPGEEALLELVERDAPLAQAPPEALAMRRHRDLVASLPDVAAPADLMARVEAALERHALVNLEQNEASQPADLVEGDGGPSVLARFADRFRSPAGQRFALAAGTVLIVGGAAYLGLSTFGGFGARRAAPIASREGPGLPSAMDAAAASEPFAPEALAARGTTPDQPHARDGAGAPTLAVAEAPAPVLLAEVGPPAPETISIERALDLAREGRLAFSVLCDSPAKASRALDSLASRRDGGQTWRLTADLSPGAVDALRAAAGEPVPAPLPPDVMGPPPLIMASAAMPRTWESSRSSAPPAFQIRSTREDHAAYLVEMGLTPESLESLRAKLSESASGVCEFIELPAPVDVPAALEPESVLWWTQPPDEWTARAAIPVVVQRW